MTGEIPTLAAVCRSHLLDQKWLLAPSRRIAHQWIERLVRDGQCVVNLRPATGLRLALDLVGPQMAERGLTVADRNAGPLVVAALWHELPRGGYFGRLEPSPELSAMAFASLLAMRRAGIRSGNLERAAFDNGPKADDIAALLAAYERFLQTHGLLDEAAILELAVARLAADPECLGCNTLVLMPADLAPTGLERDFAAALPNTIRVELPSHNAADGGGASDIRRFARFGQPTTGSPRNVDGSVRFFRAVGEINEVREVFRRCVADGVPLDQVEILHTDSETYVPLVVATARRYAGEPGWPDGIPVTFAEGVPASLSRPGRALAAWLRWIDAGFPQRMLVGMIGEGLLPFGADDLSFSYLVRLLRPMAIGSGADNYLPKLDEQIRAARAAAAQAVENEPGSVEAAARQRRTGGLIALRRCIGRLLDLSRRIGAATGPPALDAAVEFLATSARSISELDRYASEALVRQLQDRRAWLDRLDVAWDVGQWLVALPAQTRVLGSGPQPGHIHVAPADGGGHSGRPRTFVLGLDDRRFPGAPLQDPILLDTERRRLHPELMESPQRVRLRIEDLAGKLANLSGCLTLSWSCRDLADDRETFASPFLLAAMRRITGRPDADLAALDREVGAPASFAPASAEKCLDASERWLWRLSESDVRGTNQTALVEGHFPHLARGAVARGGPPSVFGPERGHVPQAGRDLDPFTAGGLILSASALETAGRCPLAFFFRHGLGLYPPDELDFDPDRWLDAAQFGSLMHEVFRRFMEELSRAGCRPRFERDHQQLAGILHEAVDAWRREFPPPNESAFRRQYWQLVQTARIFLQDEEEFCESSEPAYFEVALGLEGASGGGALDQPEPPAVVLPGGRSIRARGQIDRVDRIGAARYTIWDYKIGSGYGYDAADPFRQGRRVQSVLYLRMIEDALRKRLDPGARVERFGYFFPSIRALGLRVAWQSDELAAGTAIVERLCETIQGGAFVATDQPDDCRFCDYRSICLDTDRVNGASRALLDGEDLVPLRPFKELRRG